MKRPCTLLVMSLALLLGLWGYSMSMDSPYPRWSENPSVTGGPADGDHPWGGDQGNTGGTASIIGPNKPHVYTGSVVTDVIVNQLVLRGRLLNWFYSTRTKTPNVVTPVQPKPPVSGSTSAN